MLKFLQINMHGSRVAQDLMLQRVKETGTDIVIMSEFYRAADGWLVDATSKSALALFNSDLILGDSGRGNGYVFQVVNDVAIFSTYISPNCDLEEYTKVLDNMALELCAYQAAVLAGDFNAKSSAWGSPVTDERGNRLADLLASCGMTVCNEGGIPTFQRPNDSSYINVTAVSITIGHTVQNWRVNDDLKSFSDHLYIEFRLSRPDIKCSI